MQHPIIAAAIAALLVGGSQPAKRPPPPPPTAGGTTDTPRTHATAAPSGDTYSRLVARASAGDKTVDFHALRLAYLKSPRRLLSPADLDEVSKERRAMLDAARADAPARVAEAARKIISLVYVDMSAHKFLRQACALLHDKPCAEHEHFVEFGLLHSVINSGDGTSCATGWEVVTLDEEYFILSMIGAKREEQSVVSGGGHVCDRMQVSTNGQQRTYYFRIGALLAAQAERMHPHK